jgi:hypothetical protein
MKFIITGLTIGIAAALIGAPSGIEGGSFMVALSVKFLDLPQRELCNG